METTQFNNQLSKSHIEIFQGSLEQNENSSDDRFAYKIINIVALGVLTNKGEPLKIDFERLGETLDVKKIKRFPSVQFKVNNKSLSLFKNGKIIFTGINEEETLYKLRDKAERVLRSSHLKFDSFDLQIQNLVTITNLEKMVDLEILSLTMNNCLYEPEQFPAAIIKPDAGGTFLVFSNSKIIGLGMKDLSKLEFSLQNLIQEIFDKDLFIKVEAEDGMEFDWENFDIDL